MNAHASRIEGGPWLTGRERVAQLLERYPHVSKNENREILDFMKTGRHLEIGLLTSNEKLRPNLDAFMKDHERHFSVGFREGTAVVVLIAAFLFVLWLLWDLIGSTPA